MVVLWPVRFFCPRDLSMRAGEGSSGSLELKMSARLPAKLFSTSLKSSCGRRNVHSAALIMRIYSLAKRASDDSPEVQRKV